MFSVSVWRHRTATALRNGSADTDYGDGYGNGYVWTETKCWKPGITHAHTQ